MFVEGKWECDVAAWKVLIFSGALSPVPGLSQTPALLPRPSARPPLFPRSQVGVLMLWVLAHALSGCAGSCSRAAPTTAGVCKILLLDIPHGFSLLSSAHGRSTAWGRHSRGGHHSFWAPLGCAGAAARGKGRWLKQSRQRQRGFSAANTSRSSKPTPPELGWGELAPQPAQVWGCWGLCWERMLKKSQDGFKSEK